MDRLLNCTYRQIVNIRHDEVVKVYGIMYATLILVSCTQATPVSDAPRLLTSYHTTASASYVVFLGIGCAH